MMIRIQKFLKNSMTAMVSYGVIAICAIIVRKYFLEYLGAETLGYESLFTNIFTILSLAEMGVGGVIINYHLYRAAANENRREISVLMEIYKTVYRVIGTIVLVLGILCGFFLEGIITRNTASWSYIRLIYYIQLGSILSTYFLAYKRALFSAYQEQYLCTKIDTWTNIVCSVLKIAALILLKSYIAYLILTILRQVIANVIIGGMYRKKFTWMEKSAITIRDIRERNLFQDIRNFIWHKTAAAIFWGTDSIIISKTLGIVTVGYYNTYMLIKNQLEAIIRKLLQPLQDTMGNIVYTEAQEKKQEIFEAADFLGFFAASIFSCCFIAAIQPFISLVFGGEYLWKLSSVFLIMMNLFFDIIRDMGSCLRFVYGEYEKDRNFMIAAAIVNLAGSILLSGIWGIFGVLFATLAGNIIMWIGQSAVIVEKYSDSSLPRYLKSRLAWIFLSLTEMGITVGLTNNRTPSLSVIILSLLLGILLPAGLHLLFFFKTRTFSICFTYGKWIYFHLRKEKHRE